ncbi:plasmid mobilization relaxosome protein MobC [Cytophagaceae bacterium YF14B1]|uniref:Plasmid mobilization relaxosome protein MobC n=1 Tax=Xanthocytophaga flava TaxID=3048013 RepID=A0AAE3UBB7_9BACT|nr:plasmid mobilization relaxosome protein MobC [Xanthocytophaga flavus]MDJ1484218.1 plasmid mobilization relaxosome protein MobC [Xanthocytophaga flavus]
MSKEKENRNKWLHVRLSLEEYNQLRGNYSKATCRKLSEYSRKILLGKPVKILYRNQSLDEFMEEMIQLRKELNLIGNNFNQAVKKLNSLSKITEYRDWLISFEVEKKLLFCKVDQIKNRINQLSDQWLQ